MIILQQMMHQIKEEQEKQQDKSFKHVQFQTEMSQDAHPQEKQFAPWVRKQTGKMQDKVQKKIYNHHFLQKIHIKSKKLQKQKNPQSQQMRILRKSLQKKIRVEKICHHHHREKIELIKDNNKQKKYIEQKPYFDNNKKFNHFHQKPKCIDIRLDLTQNKSANRPYLSVPSPHPLYAESNKKKETYNMIKKSTEREYHNPSNGQKQFAQTMKDFHQNFPFTKTNFYNTVELNVFPYNPKRLASNKVDRFQYTSLNSRSNRYDELLERSKIQPNIVILCEGKNLSTSIKYARKQKLKEYFSTINS